MLASSGVAHPPGPFVVGQEAHVQTYQRWQSALLRAECSIVTSKLCVWQSYCNLPQFLLLKVFVSYLNMAE